MDELLYNAIKDRRVVVNNRSPFRQRFWSKVDKDGPIHPVHGQCWVWTGSRFWRADGEAGYGKMMFRPGEFRVHRISYIIHKGEIPEGQLVLHRCDNMPCVNPDHLFLGTHADNAKDRSVKSRGGRGALKPEVVLEICNLYRPGAGRGRYGGNSSELAKMFKVDPQVVWGILSGRTYKHLPRPFVDMGSYSSNKVEAGCYTVNSAGT